jgi:NAD(P)H-quinone oxidoreductase subunit 5
VLALGVTTSFFTLEATAHHFLLHTVPRADGLGTAHLIAISGVVAMFAVVVLMQILEPVTATSRRRREIALHLRNGLYANAMFDRVVGALRMPAADAGRAK